MARKSNMKRSRTRTKERINYNNGQSSSDNNPDELDQPEAYKVEKIMKKKISKGKTQYLVKWVGYSMNESTWEPIEHLFGCPDLIEAFEEVQANKKFQKSEKKNKNKKQPIICQKAGQKEKKKPLDQTYKTRKQLKLSNSVSALIENNEKSQTTSSTRSQRKGRSIKSDPTENKKETLEERNQEIKKLKNNKQGHYLFNDKPRKIKCIESKNGEIFFSISWQKRDDKVQPIPTIFSNTELKTYDKDILLSYYERKLINYNEKNGFDSTLAGESVQGLKQNNYPTKIRDARIQMIPVVGGVDFHCKIPNSILKYMLEQQK